MTLPSILWIIISSIGFGMAALDLLNSVMDWRALRISGIAGDRKTFVRGEIRTGIFLTLIMGNNIIVWIASVSLLAVLPIEAILYGLVISVFLLTLKIMLCVADRYQFLDKSL